MYVSRPFRKFVALVTTLMGFAALGLLATGLVILLGGHTTQAEPELAGLTATTAAPDEDTTRRASLLTDAPRPPPSLYALNREAVRQRRVVHLLTREGDAAPLAEAVTHSVRQSGGYATTRRQSIFGRVREVYASAPRSWYRTLDELRPYAAEPEPRFDPVSHDYADWARNAAADPDPASAPASAGPRAEFRPVKILIAEQTAGGTSDFAAKWRGWLFVGGAAFFALVTALCFGSWGIACAALDEGRYAKPGGALEATFLTVYSIISALSLAAGLVMLLIGLNAPIQPEIAGLFQERREAAPRRSLAATVDAALVDCAPQEEPDASEVMEAAREQNRRVYLLAHEGDAYALAQAVARRARLSGGNARVARFTRDIVSVVAPAAFDRSLDALRPYAECPRRRQDPVSRNYADWARAAARQPWPADRPVMNHSDLSDCPELRPTDVIIREKPAAGWVTGRELRTYGWSFIIIGALMFMLGFMMSVVSNEPTK